jgi:hypothetical protein
LNNFLRSAKEGFKYLKFYLKNFFFDYNKRSAGIVKEIKFSKHRDNKLIIDIMLGIILGIMSNYNKLDLKTKVRVRYNFLRRNCLIIVRI